MKVLVVDDDKLARKGLISIMDWGKYGFEVVGDVQNGRKALEFLKDNEVDIVFTDIDMPEIDGIELMKRCKKEYEKGNDVVVVLSAMGDVTDQLIDKAKEINEAPSEREMDMLFTIGEQMSVALMAMALEGLGVPAVSLNAFQAKIHTTSVHGDAKITHIETERIREELAQKKIVIVTGFQGINENDDYTTLGRGGSDTTAVALAAALQADACEIYTDVDGVYTADPRKVPTAKKLDEISYDDMLHMALNGAQVLHSRCVEMAKKFEIPLVVRSSMNEREGTVVREKTFCPCR